MKGRTYRIQSELVIKFLGAQVVRQCVCVCLCVCVYRTSNLAVHFNLIKSYGKCTKRVMAASRNRVQGYEGARGGTKVVGRSLGPSATNNKPNYCMYK